MNLLDIYKNQTDYLNIKLKSEAFDDGEPFFYKDKPDNYYEDISEVHKILYRLDKNKPLSINIYYEPIKEDYLDDLVDLHKEWFPLVYDRDHFKKFLVRKNCVALGAFLKVGLKVYLVGCVLGEIISEEKFKNYLPDVLIERSWYDVFSSSVDCGYLYSVGIIDEYRKLSIGTRLLELFTEEMKKRNVVVIYLNIISHNKSAIKFIEANNWHFYRKEKNYYKYRDNLYDAEIYYYILDINWCNIKDAPKKDENDDNMTQAEVAKRGCLESIFGSYFSSNSLSNKNDKEEKKDFSSNPEIKSNEKDNV